MSCVPFSPLFSIILATALGLSIRFPYVALAVVVVVFGMLLIGGVGFAFLAEGAFWDWVGAKLTNPRDNPQDEANDETPKD